MPQLQKQVQVEIGLLLIPKTTTTQQGFMNYADPERHVKLYLKFTFHFVLNR